ncbi:MAG: hypothetical protein WBY53_06510 [Acidobacteriaceae bacterium]
MEAAFVEEDFARRDGQRDPHLEFGVYPVYPTQPRSPNYYGQTLSLGQEAWDVRRPSGKEPNVFERLIVLKDQTPLLEASSKSQPIGRYNYLPNGVPEFRLFPINFPVPQGTTR